MENRVGTTSSQSSIQNSPRASSLSSSNSQSPKPDREKTSILVEINRLEIEKEKVYHQKESLRIEKERICKAYEQMEGKEKELNELIAFKKQVLRSQVNTEIEIERRISSATNSANSTPSISRRPSFSKSEGKLSFSISDEGTLSNIKQISNNEELSSGESSVRSSFATQSTTTSRRSSTTSFWDIHQPSEFSYNTELMPEEKEKQHKLSKILKRKITMQLSEWKHALHKEEEEEEKFEEERKEESISLHDFSLSSISIKTVYSQIQGNIQGILEGTNRITNLFAKKSEKVIPSKELDKQCDTLEIFCNSLLQVTSVADSKNSLQHLTNKLKKQINNFVQATKKLDSSKVKNVNSKIAKITSQIFDSCSVLYFKSVSATAIASSAQKIESILKSDDWKTIYLSENGVTSLQTIKSLAISLMKLAESIGKDSSDEIDQELRNLSKVCQAFSNLCNNTQITSKKDVDPWLDIHFGKIGKQLQDFLPVFQSIMIRQSEFQCTQQQEIQIKEKQTHLTLSLSSAITTIAELICEFLTLLKYQLLELLQSSQNSKTTIRPRAMASYLAQQRSTSNLWREYSQSSVKISPNFELKETSLNELIALITNPSLIDSEVVKIFLHTWCTICYSSDLISKLLERYDVPKEYENERSAVELGVISFLRLWLRWLITSHYLPSSQLKELNTFLEKIKANHPKDYEELFKLLNNLESKKENFFNKLQVITPVQTNVALSGLLLNCNEESIAKELTRIEFPLFQAIQPPELLNQIWNHNKFKYRASNVLNLIERFNEVGLWIATNILSQYSFDDRVRVIEKSINVAEYLRNLNNFNGLFSVLSGLQMASVHRLKSNEKISKIHKQKLSTLLKLVDSKHSFQNYRESLASATGPCLPYLGLHLTDLTFIDEGNPSEINGKLNFVKCQLLYKSISQIQTFQKIKYDIPIQSTPTQPLFLQKLPHLNRDQLWELSIALEPNNRTQ